MGILFAGLVIAYFTTAHCGESWDESMNRVFGYASLRAYGGSRGFMSYGFQVYHGPFYYMIWVLLTHC